MGAEPRDRSPRREVYEAILIRALAMGARQKDAAREAGVSVRTVRRREQEPEFRARIAAARREMLARAGGRAAALAMEAVERLRDLLLSGADPTVQLRAAQLLIDAGRKLVPQEDLTDRVDALEQTLTDLGDGRAR